MSLLVLFLIFAKIAVLTFGGGYAMVPLFQNEIVTRHEILSAADTCRDGFSERDIVFTTFWTRKEAFAKLIGEGISTNVRDILCECMDIAFTTRVEKEKGYVLTVAERKTT